MQTGRSREYQVELRFELRRWLVRKATETGVALVTKTAEERLTMMTKATH
jgi:hypothetical protein